MHISSNVVILFYLLFETVYFERGRIDSRAGASVCHYSYSDSFLHLLMFSPLSGGYFSFTSTLRSGSNFLTTFSMMGLISPVSSFTLWRTSEYPPMNCNVAIVP